MDTATPQIQTITTSPRGKIDWRDLLTVAEYGAITGILGALGSAANSVAAAPHIFSVDPKVVLSAGAVGAIGALIQKWKSQSQTIVTNPQDVAAVNQAAAAPKS